jgi:L-gulono-1,4-lactone dehydrogenase
MTSMRAKLSAAIRPLTRIAADNSATSPGPPPWRNWAGNQTARPSRLARPDSVEELQASVTAARGDGLRVKPLGAGHSFTAIAATDGVHLDLTGLDRLVRADRATGLVTVEGGLPIDRLNRILLDHDLGLPNLGDIDRQTITGAIATGTHGTGAQLGGLAAAVAGFDVVTAGGELVHADWDTQPELFAAGRVSLGALGVVARVTLQCVPAFRLHAAEGSMPLHDVLERIDELVDAHDHFEFYWFPHTPCTLTKANDRVPPDTAARPPGRLRAWIDDELLSNRAFELVNRIGARRPALVPCINAISGRALSAREYVDDSYRVFASRRRVRFVEMEYAIPRAAVADALRAVRRWIDSTGTPVSFPIEVRFAAADDGWLSTAYERESAYIAVHLYHRADQPAYFEAVEAIMAEHAGRPHWGKLHGLDAAALRERYPRFDDFRAVRAELDPTGVFGNAYLDRVLGPID